MNLTALNTAKRETLLCRAHEVNTACYSERGHNFIPAAMLSNLGFPPFTAGAFTG